MKLTKHLSVLLLSLVAFSATTARADAEKEGNNAQNAADKKATELVQKYDTNGDGMLSAAELSKAITDKSIMVKGEKKPKKEKEADHQSEE